MNDVVSILKKVGAILNDDHFVFVSGKHSDIYVNKDALNPHPLQASEVGKLFAQKFAHEEVDVVVAPALGGIVLSQWTAYHLSKIKGKEVLGVYTEKVANDGQVFTRGYDALVKGKRVLVIEDTTTTGGSVRKVVDRVKEAGGEVVAVGVMINRDPKGVTSEVVGAPFTALGIFEAPAYDPAECPLCKAGKPINTKIGHGKKYMEAKGR